MKLLDVVATILDLPEKHVAKGQAGTIVEELDDENVLVAYWSNSPTWMVSHTPLRQFPLSC
ncbi:MAG: DUF4926 domain-containing protein [Propionivibrio sp.]